MLKRSFLAVGFLVISITSFATVSDEQIAAAFEKGCDLIQPFVTLSDKAQSDPSTPAAKVKIRQGIQLLKTVVQAQPKNWPAFWFIGKGHQAMQEHTRAEVAFSSAYAINPTHPDVARELVIESICVNKTAVAVSVAKSIAKSHPKDSGLAANLGLAYLANGQLKEAKIAIVQSLAIAPDDQITQALLSEVNSVQRGKKPISYCPS